MRHSFFAQFLLIFALLFAQMGGLTHGISHVISDKAQDQSAPHHKLCDLCATYAQLGSALGSHAIQFVSIELKSALVVAPLTRLLRSIFFSAFSARAPPYAT